MDVTGLLRTNRPTHGRRRHALLHMWGYLDDAPQPPEHEAEILRHLQAGLSGEQIPYLLHSTALADFPGMADVTVKSPGIPDA